MSAEQFRRVEVQDAVELDTLVWADRDLRWKVANRRGSKRHKESVEPVGRLGSS
jgi:hypothetical protein